MTQLHAAYDFAGAKASDRKTASWPSWALDLYENEEHPVDPRYAFENLVAMFNEEYGVATRSAAYKDAKAGDFVADEQFRAVVNPAWEGRDDSELPEGRDSALWSMFTASYAPVTPRENFEKFILLLDEFGFAANTFGRFFLYRHGGDVSADIWFPDVEVTIGDDEYVFGVQTQYDYFGSNRLEISIIAVNTSQGVVLRDLPIQGFKRKQTGAAGKDMNREQEQVLKRVEAADDVMKQVTAEAMEHTVNFETLPIGLDAYFTGLLGSSRYAKDAVEKLPFPPSGNRETATYSAYQLYVAAGRAVEERFDGKVSGDQRRTYAQQINRQLFSPVRAQNGALAAAQKELVAQEELSDSDRETLSQIADHRQSLAEASKDAEDVREKLGRLIRESVEEEEGTNSEASDDDQSTDSESTNEHSDARADGGLVPTTFDDFAPSS
jgi:hypothetical protein